MGKLTAVSVKAATKPGRYVDGDGLSLVVKPPRKEGASGTRSWVLRVQVDGTRRDFGLGSVDAATRSKAEAELAEKVSILDRHKLTLAEAREKAQALRRMAKAGIDPIAEKKKRTAPALPTFKVAAERLHAELKPSWKAGKHRDDWLSSLERHAYPKLGKLTVDAIDGPMIVETLLPIWLTVPETARRVRQRIAAVLDWANAKGFRSTEAPMRSVTKGLPRQLAPRTHFAAMPYPDAPAFVAALESAPETMGRQALRFLMLTAARSGEVRGATWAELDLDAAKWSIPASRMKAKVAHEVPLSAPAVAILRKLADARSGDLVFPGAVQHVGGKLRERPLSDMTLTKIMRDAKQPYTVHGFRSTFRDWIGEQTSFPGEVAEAALAHVIANPTERAYHRTKYFEKRVALMDAWAAFLSGANNVVRLVTAA